MIRSCFLISGGHEAWLSDSLVPVNLMAKFPDHRIATLLKRLEPRPGAAYRYMESCEIDCEIVDGHVVEVRNLVIYRPEKVVLV
jgi:hypothetical protein